MLALLAYRLGTMRTRCQTGSVACQALYTHVLRAAGVQVAGEEKGEAGVWLPE